MDNASQDKTAAVFGASGGIGRALCRRLQERGYTRIFAGSRADDTAVNDVIQPFTFDLGSEASIEAAAKDMADTPPDIVLVATGVLTLADGAGPERSLRNLDPEVMRQVFQLNTIGPALVAKHMLPLMPRERRCVFAALSARIGSIGDNRIGGWHSYRASKAALNMLIRNFSIEMARTHKQAIIVGLHPGTVDTQLSQPFQGGLPEGQLLAPDQSAGSLLDVIDTLVPADSGNVFDWAGKPVPA